MTSLYKYMKREYAESLLSEGCVKIGTLYEYWPMEIHGNEIGDSNEAMAFCEIPADQIAAIMNDGNPSAMATWVRDILIKSPESKNFKTFFANYMAVNQYVFCASSEYDENVMRSFSCDACVEIWNTGPFFDIISDALRERTNFRGLYMCKYRPRGFLYGEASSIVPELLKHPSYSHQKEVRGLWYPKAFAKIVDANPVDAPLPSINSVLVKSGGLAMCCRMFKTL